SLAVESARTLRNEGAVPIRHGPLEPEMVFRAPFFGVGAARRLHAFRSARWNAVARALPPRLEQAPVSGARARDLGSHRALSFSAGPVADSTLGSRGISSGGTRHFPARVRRPELSHRPRHFRRLQRRAGRVLPICLRWL